MKKELQAKREQMSWSLVSGITYATIPAWYGATYRDLKLSLCIPKFRDNTRYPLLIWICGGAFMVMDRDVWWPQWTELAKRGCIIASVEYRTSNEAVFPAALEDVKAAIRYLKANADKYSIDPDRVFVSGESAGGALASLAGVTGTERKYDIGAYLEQSSCVNGVIDFYGVVDIRGKAITSNGDDPAGAEDLFLGAEGKYVERRAEASAVCHITPDTPPFLILHGDLDDLVPIDQSNLLYNELISNGVKASYYILNGAHHGDDAFYQKDMMDIYWKFIQGELCDDSK